QVKRCDVPVGELDAAIRAFFGAVADLGKNRPVPSCRRIGRGRGRRLSLLTASGRLARRLGGCGSRLLLLPTACRLTRSLAPLCLLLCLCPLLYAHRLDGVGDASLDVDRVLLGLRAGDPQREQRPAENREGSSAKRVFPPSAH